MIVGVQEIYKGRSPLFEGAPPVLVRRFFRASTTAH